jgi:glycolate oxidase FAD binding subunit
MSATARSESQLAGVVGTENIALDPEILSRYAAAGVAPACVARPGTAKEAAELVRIAAMEKLAVIATGARTKLDIGLPPARYDVAIDMTRLAKIVAYDPGDLTLSVEAGIPLASVLSALEEKGQFLPLAAPFLERTTIGGTIASGMDGPMRQLFGTPRDYILGMEFVTGEGVLTKSGGRVVKNVTGYDLHKLMIGALGSLGIVTKINFRTFPMPNLMRGFVARFESVEAALDLRHRIAKSPLAPWTLEIFSPGSAKFLFGNGAAESQWLLITTYAGSEKVLARYESELQRMASDAGAGRVETVSENLGALMNRVGEFVPATLEALPAATIMKLSVLPTSIAGMLNRARSESGGAGISWLALARGVGVIYFALLPASADDASLRKVASVTETIAAACHELNGNFTIPWSPVKWKPSLQIWGPRRDDLAQMQKLKNVFDPRAVLAPGRCVGGL